MKQIMKIVLTLVIIVVGINSMNYATDEVSISDEVLLPKDNYELIRVKGKVLSTGDIYDDESSGFVTKIQEVKVKITEGEYKDRTFSAKYSLSYDIENKIMCHPLDKHDTVFIQINTLNGEVEKVLVEDVVRQNYIFAMIAVFFVLVIAIGGRQGIKAIISLTITILLIWFITILSIYRGYSPILMSVITSVLTTVICFIITAGLNKKSVTAMIGTSGGVMFAGLIAMIFGYLAKLSGGGEEAVMLSINAKDIAFNFRELLFAGIIISALGACMDVGMSIASALDELKQKNEGMSWGELLKSGMNIGRDVMSTMTNTLILAYVGSSLILILLFMSANFGVIDMINKETIASEIIGALAGTTGVVCTIPITSIVYALFFRNKKDENRNVGGKTRGRRELKI